MSGHWVNGKDDWTDESPQASPSEHRRGGQPPHNPNDPGPETEETQNRQRTRSAVTTLILVTTLALFLSSTLPPALVPVALKGFLFWGAFGAVVLGALRGDSWRAPYLTGWDQALILLFLSKIAALFIDPEAVDAATKAMGGGA